MKHICFLAQFPPPIHGLSKAIDTLYNSSLFKKYHFSKIDITKNSHIFRTIWLVCRGKCDLFYFTPSQTRWGNLRDLALMKLISLRGRQCLVHIHGGYFRKMVDEKLPQWQRKANYRAVSRLAGGIVLGQSLRNIFTGILPENKIYVCPNCVDDAYIASSIDEKQKGMMASGPLQVLYLSNFIASKGYNEVLSLARMAMERGDGDKYKFHFAGKFFSQKDEENFLHCAQELPNVVYHGVVSGQTKVDLLQLCHIFVLLSRYFNEGQPISILEAMGNGMAVVTTDHAGIPEIASAENGFVCSKTNIDVEAVYHYLSHCYENRKQLSDVCCHNYEVTKERYTERNYIEQMDKIFSEVCKK